MSDWKRLWLVCGCTATLSACNGDVNLGTVSAALSHNAYFVTAGSPIGGSLPNSTSARAQIDVTQSGIAPLEIRPGGSMQLSLYWGAGGITAVNATFDNVGYFNMPVPPDLLMAEQGLFQVAASTYPRVCENLDTKCFDAELTAQLQQEEGTYSTPQIFHFALNCSNELSCSGDTDAGGGSTLMLDLTPTGATISSGVFSTVSAVTRYLEGSSTTIYATDRDILNPTGPCRSVQIVSFSELAVGVGTNLDFMPTSGYATYGERTNCDDATTESRWVSTSGAMGVGKITGTKVEVNFDNLVLQAATDSHATGSIAAVGNGLLSIPNFAF